MLELFCIDLFDKANDDCWTANTRGVLPRPLGFGTSWSYSSGRQNRQLESRKVRSGFVEAMLLWAYGWADVSRSSCSKRLEQKGDQRESSHRTFRPMESAREWSIGRDGNMRPTALQPYIISGWCGKNSRGKLLLGGRTSMMTSSQIVINNPVLGERESTCWNNLRWLVERELQGSRVAAWITRH